MSAHEKSLLPVAGDTLLWEEIGAPPMPCTVVRVTANGRVHVVDPLGRDGVFKVNPKHPEHVSGALVAVTPSSGRLVAVPEGADIDTLRARAIGEYRVLAGQASESEARKLEISQRCDERERLYAAWARITGLGGMRSASAQPPVLSAATLANAVSELECLADALEDEANRSTR